MKRMLIALALIAGLLCLGACNTIQGAGKDIQKAGEAVEKAARRAKND